MGIYRCAACGSPNVMTDTQANGVNYNYLKGAVGTVLLGVGGAAAGIASQQQTVYKCPDCGMVLTYPMSAALADLIDIGVMYPKARSQLKIMNVDVPWEFIEKKYKNIGKTYRKDSSCCFTKTFFCKFTKMKHMFRYRKRIENIIFHPCTKTDMPSSPEFAKIF